MATPTKYVFSIKLTINNHSKFLPVIGRLVADIVDGQISEEVKAKFSIARSLEKVRPSRDGVPVPLVVKDLATKDDLKS